MVGERSGMGLAGEWSEIERVGVNHKLKKVSERSGTGNGGWEKRDRKGWVREAGLGMEGERSEIGKLGWKMWDWKGWMREVGSKGLMPERKWPISLTWVVVLQVFVDLQQEVGQYVPCAKPCYEVGHVLWRFSRLESGTYRHRQHCNVWYRGFPPKTVNVRYKLFRSAVSEELSTYSSNGSYHHCHNCKGIENKVTIITVATVTEQYKW